MTMDDPTFVRRFAQALRPGAYLTIVEAGEVGTGDVAELVSKPGHELTLEEMTRLYFFDREHIANMLVPELPAHWRDWVLEHRVDRSKSV